MFLIIQGYSVHLVPELKGYPVCRIIKRYVVVIIIMVWFSSGHSWKPENNSYSHFISATV